MTRLVHVRVSRPLNSYESPMISYSKQPGRRLIVLPAAILSCGAALERMLSCIRMHAILITIPMFT